MEKAKGTYLAAMENFSNARYLDANNRAYYSIFHSLRAILAIDRVDFKKHSGVISYFREKYIKTNLFEEKHSDIISKASMIRNKSDYEDFYIASREESQEQIDNAKVFYDAVEEYLLGYMESR